MYCHDPRRFVELVIFWSMLLSLGLSSLAEGTEWSVLPSIGTKAYYNSNLILTPFPHDATYGYWVSPAAEFAGKTERFEGSGRIAADFVSYYGGEETQFTNIFLPLTLRYKTEKDVFGFTGGYTRDNTLMGELLATGVVLQFTQRDLWSANPAWTKMLTEKLSLQTAFQFAAATYEDGLRLGLVDYQLLGGSAGLGYQVDEQNLVQITGSYTNYYTTNSPSPFRAYFPGLTAELTHSFTETLTANVYGGSRYVNSTTTTANDSVKSRQTIWVFGASVTKKFEQASVKVKVSRDVVPSGFGLLIQTDRLGVLASYDVTETVTASLDAAGYLVSGVTETASGGDFPGQRYAHVSPRLSWKFFDWWKLEASYTYGWRDVDTFANTATSNAAMLTLTYFPPKLAMSN